MPSDAVLLKFAKTKMIMKDSPSVKNAKKFSELTPTKQKLARSSYENKMAKKTPQKKKPKPPVKKERRKTYYAGYDRLDKEAMEMMESDGWKQSFQYGEFTVLKRLMSSLSEDAMEVYENAPYRSIGKKLVYGNRQDFK